MFKAILQLPRTVWLLGLVSLFNDSTSELIYPLVRCFSPRISKADFLHYLSKQTS
jgi:hypothetical protein